MTGSFMLAVIIFLMMPRASLELPIPQGAMPLTLEFRQLAPPRPPEPRVKQTIRKLLAEDPLPESLLLPEPPPEPEPVKQETPKPEPPKPEPIKQEPVKLKPKPKTEPAKQTKKPDPKPVEQAVQREAAPTGEITAALSTEQAKPAPVGHADGGAVRNRNGEILAVLLHAVEANKQYPKNARRIGAEGEVTLKVRINAQGMVTGCALVKECGTAVLDKAAIALGDKLAGLSIPPARGTPVEVLVPVRYTLK